MNATEVQAGYRPAQESTTKVIGNSAILESIGALATIALAVVGLAGALPTVMAAIATIVLGAAILIEGGAFAARFSEGVSRSGTTGQPLEWSERLSIEFLGGLTGIVLGVLALLGTAPLTLLSVAALVYGVTFMLGGISMGSHSQSILGFAAVVLGIVAIVGLSPMPLVLAALATLGASALLAGSAAYAKFAPGMLR
jgi:hypothetical protein